MKYLIGIDAGTTSMKGILIDEYGNKVCLASENYSLITQNKFEVEIQAETYWEAFKKIISRILNMSKVNPEDIKAIAVDSQGETLICVDDNGEPLRKAIVWLDNRSIREAEEIRNNFNMEEIFNKTGQPEVAATWPATKIMWIKKYEKHTFAKTNKYLLVGDYINFKLSGKYVTDKSLISSTLYFDIRKGGWWKEILDFIGITEEQLPYIEASGMKIGSLTYEAVRETGLSKNTIVVTGALDQMAGAIGAGNISPEVISESTGTCLAVCVNIPNPISYNEKYRIPCHCNALSRYNILLEESSSSSFNQSSQNKYINQYSQYSLLFWSQTAGVILEWFKDNFYKSHETIKINSNCNSTDNNKCNKNSDSELFKHIDYEAAKIDPGSEGLILLPHFSGSAVPDFNPGARGVFFGITLKHTKAHFARAIMEAIGFMLREHIEMAESFGVNIKEIRALGGGAKSSLWNQIKADITGKEIITLENTETTSLGAAILAGIGVGIFKDFNDACSKCVRVKERFYPHAEKKLVYDEAFKKYKKIYENVKHLF